jgi:WhiB family redox-sensing transcriptional regulator
MDDWMESGACRDWPSEMFYPSDGAGVVRARRVCKRCAVREECLDYALKHHIAHGIWGGTSERQRLRIASEQRWTA